MSAPANINIKLAFIIDGTVVEIIHTDDRMAAIFLSEPQVVEIEDLSLRPGATYDANTGTFTPATAE